MRGVKQRRRERLKLQGLNLSNCLASPKEPVTQCNSTPDRLSGRTICKQIYIYPREGALHGAPTSPT